MKIAVQTHQRSDYQLNHEYDKIIEAGYEPASYGYYIDHENHTIKIVGLEDIALDEYIFNRASLQIIRYYFVLKYKFIGHIPNGFFETMIYNIDGFNIENQPTNPIMINKTPGKYHYSYLNDALNDLNFEDTFYKPINDLKVIAGTLVPAGSRLKDIIGNSESFSDRALSSKLLVSTNAVKLDREVRCFVVNGKVITCGQYMKDGKHNIDHINEDEENFFIVASQNLIDNFYKPDINCTIDIGMISGIPHIIEYNCLNTSGMYNINSKKLFDALKEMFVK